MWKGGKKGGMKVQEHPLLHDLVGRKESFNCSERPLYHFDVMSIIGHQFSAQAERFS